MPIEFFAEVRGEREVLARLDALPDELQNLVRPEIERLTQELLSRVQSREPVRTGALRAATTSYVNVSDNAVRGRVRVGPEPQQGAHNVKAAALEYGAHGPVNVSAHAQSLDHVFDTAIDPEQVMVAAYQRDVNITEHRFLRDSMAGFQAELEIAVSKAIAELARTF